MGKKQPIGRQFTLNSFIGSNTPIIVSFKTTYDMFGGPFVTMNAIWTKEGDNLINELNGDCLDRLEASCYESLEALC